MFVRLGRAVSKSCFNGRKCYNARQISNSRLFPGRWNFRWPLISGLAIAGSITVAALYGSMIESDTGVDLNSIEFSNGVTVEELQNHKTEADGVWVVINGYVYDLTEFMYIHPGGKGIILKYAGRDASKIFNPIHAKDIVDKFLPKDKHLGKLIGELPEEEEDLTLEEIERMEKAEHKPPLSQIFNVSDFQYVARETLPPNAWAYYSSAADDEITFRENHYSFHRVFFNPKILVDVKDVDCSTSFLGEPTSVPFYCSATALAKLGYEGGEVSIAQGCGRAGVIQMFSTLASCSFDEITDLAKPDQLQWFQLYVNPDRSVSYGLIDKCEEKNIKGIFVTVDAPVLGNREKDRRLKFIDDLDILDGDSLNRDEGAARLLSPFIDTALTWKDILDFKSKTKIPIVIKGIQRPQDVVLAAENGVDAVVLSNHGGRQLEFARAPLEVLADTMPLLKSKKLDDKIEIYIDGGVTRGTDILKLICLGAKGVGMGRLFLYANSTYGADGVTKLCDILKLEIENSMRLLGVNKLSELGPEFVDTRNLLGRVTLDDKLYNSVYLPLGKPAFKDE